MASAIDHRKELRAAEAIRLRVSGKTYREVAAELGVSVGSIYADIKGVLEVTRKETLETAEEARAIELERLDSIWAKVASVIETSAAEPELQLKAIDRLLKVSDQRAKLLGLYAPVKQEIAAGESPGGFNPALAARLVREAFGEHARPKNEIVSESSGSDILRPSEEGSEQRAGDEGYPALPPGAPGE